MKMDHELINISTNDALGLQPPNAAFTVVPPYGSVEAKYDTLMLNFRFTGDPNPHFGYIASYRKFEMKDKTEEYEFLSSVRGDVGASQRVEGGAGEAGALIREHVGWSIETLRGEVHVLPVHGLRVALAYNQDDRKFDLGEFADVKDKSASRQRRLGLALGELSTAASTLEARPGHAERAAHLAGRDVHRHRRSVPGTPGAASSPSRRSRSSRCPSTGRRRRTTSRSR